MKVKFFHLYHNIYPKSNIFNCFHASWHSNIQWFSNRLSKKFHRSGSSRVFQDQLVEYIGYCLRAPEIYSVKELYCIQIANKGTIYCRFTQIFWFYWCYMWTTVNCICRSRRSGYDTLQTLNGRPQFYELFFYILF